MRTLFDDEPFALEVAATEAAVRQATLTDLFAVLVGPAAAAAASTTPLWYLLKRSETLDLPLDERVRLAALRHLVERLAGEPAAAGRDVVSTPDEAAALFGHLTLLAHEELWVAFLDVKNRLLHVDRLAVGTAATVELEPQHVFRLALRWNAAAVIVAHNHPSGDVRPSQADCELTDRLRAAGQLVGVKLLDHVILASGRHHSFAQLW